ncbi:hypothetical protein RvY_16011 [Ramazzottius varieornatus]|uniref:SAM domain-containing protein n=1 Tax=Ramazzottius varieornatus TaxID=947166 RepID=A0A1D1VZY2_RAMVA|nr:hypothetical protein RvY_16011 [Ramazzottius varieornatus]
MSKSTGREREVRATSTKGKPPSSSQGSQREFLVTANPTPKAAPSASQPANTSTAKPVKEPLSSGSSGAASKPGGRDDSRLTEWKNFFLDSGIPDHASAEYAAIFVKERINWQILKNLDKGYLTDMGINCIGDQIAILQAAKRYCGEQYHPNITLSFPKPKQLSPQLESNGSDMMEVEEIASPSNNSSRSQMANSVAPQQQQNAPSDPPVRRMIRSEVRTSGSLPAVRTVSRVGPKPEQTSIHLRLGKRSADDDSDLRTIIKRPGFGQSERVVRDTAPVDFTVRMGAGPGAKRDVFSRLNPKGTKTNNNTSLVRVLETKMSRLTTGQSSSGNSGNSSGPLRPTLVSDKMDEPTPVFSRLGSGETGGINGRSDRSGRNERPAPERASGSSVFSRLGYQTSKNRSNTAHQDDALKPKLSVHDRLGYRS